MDIHKIRGNKNACYSKNYKFWFCTGSQIHGDECLGLCWWSIRGLLWEEPLIKSGNLLFEVVWNLTLITNEAIRKTLMKRIRSEMRRRDYVGCIIAATGQELDPASEYRKPASHLGTTHSV